MKTLILEGGFLPRKAHENPRGHDIAAAAIVNDEWDPLVPHQRKRLWDFKSTPESFMQNNIQGNTYFLHPGETVSLGMGVVFGMMPGRCAWIARRSSTARKKLGAEILPHFLGSCMLPEMADILDLNIEVPIDPDFRGEPLVILENAGKKSFPIVHGQMITQLIFTGPDNNWYPDFEIVSSIHDLGETKRGNKNNGSSGHLHHSKVH